MIAGLGTLLSAVPLQAQVPPNPLGIAGLVVDSIFVVGDEGFPENAVRSAIGLADGQQITYQDVLDAERRLWASGQFTDISVTLEGGGADPIALLFTVARAPTITGLLIQGLTRVRERDVWEAGGVQTGDFYSPAKVAASEKFIVDELVGRGIPFAVVNRRIDDVGGGGVFITLEVTEGQRVTVADLRFNGNDFFSDEELRGMLTTKKEGFWWWQVGDYSEAALQDDLIEVLPEFYASRGHLDFQVLGDTLIVDPRTGKARIEIDISEGPQYVVAAFSVSGNRVFTRDQLEGYYAEERGGLLRALGLGGGDSEDGLRVFDQTAFQEATLAVQSLYANEGYLSAQVIPEIERLPSAAEGARPGVEVRWVINEGQPAYVRRVNIEGNDHTHDWVIRDRIALLPGDRYSQDLMLRSYQNIQGLGFFETPLPYPTITQDEASGDIDVTFHVVERQTGTLNFGTTVAGYYGVTGFIGYTEPNIFGQAKSGDLRWEFGQYQNSFQLTYTDPALLRSRVSGSVSLFDARDRNFSFTSGERRYRGLSFRFGFPIPGSFYTRFFTGYSLSRTEYRLRGGGEDASLFGREPATQSQFSISIARQTVDHPLFPTVGSEQSWTIEFNGGILGGDGAFTKHRMNGTWWIPVGQVGGGGPNGRPIVFALGLHASAGAIFGDADPFPFDRFWVGGVQFGERLRGYEETTVTPVGYVARGSSTIQEAQRLGDAFLQVGAEYAIRLSDIFSVSAFFEAANVWRTPSEVDPSRLRRGAGFGIEMVTPIIPSIGMDLAYGFDRPDPGWELHFSMGGAGF